MSRPPAGDRKSPSPEDAALPAPPRSHRSLSVGGDVSDDGTTHVGPLFRSLPPRPPIATTAATHSLSVPTTSGQPSAPTPTTSPSPSPIHFYSHPLLTTPYRYHTADTARESSSSRSYTSAYSPVSSGYGSSQQQQQPSPQWMNSPVFSLPAPTLPRRLQSAEEIVASVHLRSPSSDTWYNIARWLQPKPGWRQPAAAASPYQITWTYPNLISAWSVQPSRPEVWQRILDERPANVDLDDRQLAADLRIPWRYFVVFVSVDLAAITATDSTYSSLRDAIERKQCHCAQLWFLLRQQAGLPTLVHRIVFAFTNKVRAEDAMSTALYSVNYSLEPDKPQVALLSSSSFLFACGQYRYVASSLHGRFYVNRQRIFGLGHVMLADAFRTDDTELADAREVGRVICDWRNDYVDVGLVQLLDEHESYAECYSENEVVAYMKPLMRDIAESRTTRVLVHSAACFRGVAGEGPIPGTILEVKTIQSSTEDQWHHLHFVVKLDPPYTVLLGQSGSAVTLEDGGRPVGMLVARYEDDHTKALVTPLHHIYASLNSVLPADGALWLCRERPVAVPTSEHATKHIVGGSVLCGRTGRRHVHTAVAQVDCCREHSDSALRRVMLNDSHDRLFVRAAEWYMNDIAADKYNVDLPNFGFI